MNRPDAHLPGPPASTPSEPSITPTRRALRAAIWLPGLAVALGAAAATAHGLYEVALAARVPAGIAWLYPLITDGLALVSYAATACLRGAARRYAWSVVVLAAGLSGLAQASFLAGDAAVTAPAALRFGVGAWPAIAAAIVAHLLHLLAMNEPTDVVRRDRAVAAVRAEAYPVPPSHPPVEHRPELERAGDRAPVPAFSPSAPDTHCSTSPDPPDGRRPSTTSRSSARERARAAAAGHAARHGALPTVTQLTELAAVGRGTAARALKALREHGSPLHLVTETPEHRSRP